MRQIICILVIAAFSMLWAMPRGTTQKELVEDGAIVGSLQPTAHLPKPMSGSPAFPTARDEWMDVDSLQLDLILAAGASIGIEFYHPSQTLQVVSNQGLLTEEAQLAVNKAPHWLRADLAYILRQLNAANQQVWAGIINDATDPYIDEIAFAVAHSSLLYLNSAYANPQLFVENAVGLYETDEDLPYVQIMDYGTSATDEDYYSTTRYYKTTADSQVVMVEVPREIYYWYLVHPKITDEIPAYINPDTIENNSTHMNNIILPPTGVFWRSYLYTVQEGTYPVLGTALQNCTTLYNRNSDTNDAIHAAQNWINATMSFTSNAERPHQPVRIYKKHFGRCGEYADYTAAVARTALIPCTSILSASTDHTWNEFWEDGWVQWEPVNGYINVPLVYENGWGKVFGSVMEIRSDGFLTNVTDRYSQGWSTLNIHVCDSLSVPVDGARIVLAMLDGTTNRFDTAAYTDIDGNTSLVVGDSRQYSLRIESSVGWHPQPVGTYLLVTSNAVAGETYDFNVSLPYLKPQPFINQVPPPDDQVLDWRFNLSYFVPKQIVSGVITWDDIDYLTGQPLFYKTLEQPGRMNLLLTDADNYMFYDAADMADACGFFINAAGGTQLAVNLPANQDWYAFVDNSHQVANPQFVTGCLTLQHYGVPNADETIVPEPLTLLAPYPNPFCHQTLFAYRKQFPGKMQINIYNVKGQLIKNLLNTWTDRGSGSVIWDGTDSSGKSVGTGVYFCKLESAGRHQERKLLLLR